MLVLSKLKNKRRLNLYLSSSYFADHGLVLFLLFSASFVFLLFLYSKILSCSWLFSKNIAVYSLHLHIPTYLFIYVLILVYCRYLHITYRR